MNIKKLNNKGFVVSTILYTVLIAFLLFLAVTLDIFSSAISTVGSANKDLINASEFRAIQAIHKRDETFNKQWFEETSDILLQINTKYGVYYWPKDFGLKIELKLDQNETIQSAVLTSVRENVGTSYNGKIKVECTTFRDIKVDSSTCEEFDLTNFKNDGDLLRFKVSLNEETITTIEASIGIPDN